METKLLLMTVLALSVFMVSYAQSHNVTEAAASQGKSIVFRFVADNDIFFIPYQGSIWNAGATVTVTTTEGVMDYLPEWFFSGKVSATIEADKSHDITVTMKQEVCQLNITLTVTEGDPARISSVTGTLAGVAGAWNFDTDKPVGVAMKVEPAFTRNDDKITATVRLLGIVPSATQVLTLLVIFSDNSTQTIEKDMSSLLKGFNTDKHIPAGIKADVNIPM